MTVATARPDSHTATVQPGRPWLEPPERMLAHAGRRPVDPRTDWPSVELPTDEDELTDALKGMYYCG